MKKSVYILNKVLSYGFLVMGIILIFHGTDRISTTTTAFSSFIASLGLAWITKKRSISDKYEVFVNIALWLNAAGEIVLYYFGFLYYDKILHFSVGVLISAMVYDYYSKQLKPQKEVIFFTVMGMLCIWEIFEYSLMVFFGFPDMGVIHNGVVIQSPLDDTMWDLIMGCVGTLLYLIFKKEKVGDLLKKGGKGLKLIKSR